MLINLGYQNHHFFGVLDRSAGGSFRWGMSWCRFVPEFNWRSSGALRSGQHRMELPMGRLGFLRTKIPLKAADLGGLKLATSVQLRS